MVKELIGTCVVQQSIPIHILAMLKPIFVSTPSEK